MTCIEFAFHPVCLRRKRKMPGVSCVSCAVLFSTVSSACESMCTTVPTMLPIRKAPLSLAFDPLDNQEIAFGVARFALRRFP